LFYIFNQATMAEDQKFIWPQNGKMPGINEGKRRRKLAVNKDKWIAFVDFWLATYKSP